MSLKCTDTLVKDDLIDICNEFVKTFAAEQQWLGKSQRCVFKVCLDDVEERVGGINTLSPKGAEFSQRRVSTLRISSGYIMRKPRKGDILTTFVNTGD